MTPERRHRCLHKEQAHLYATQVCCLCIFWFRVRLLWVLEIAMEYSRHNGLNHPLVKHSWLKWSRDKYNTWRNKGLGLAYSSHNARKKLLTTCQHWKHNITCLSDWPIHRCRSQLRPSRCPNLSCDQFSQTCSTGGKIAPGVYILPHKAKQACISCLIK